jgi:sulfatase modifying factor 1
VTSSLALLLALLAQAPAPQAPTAKPCLNVAVAGMRCVAGGMVELGTNDEHRCAQGENRNRKTTFGPAFQVFVDTVYVDETEVTIEAYNACVAAKKCTKDGPRYNDYSRPQQPVTAITWFHARDFCTAHGKRLPTENEWERAALDATPPACPAVVLMDSTGRSCGTPKKPPHPEKGRVLEVKSTPPNAFGLYEMRGNAEEWVADWFAPQRSSSTPNGPCAGAEACAKNPLKLVKGGSWYWPAEHATAWHRRPWQPTNKPPHHFGFRCAVDVERAAAITP